MKFGKKVKQVALPKDDQVKKEITVSPSGENDIYDQLSAKEQLRLEIEAEMPELLVVPEKLNMPDQLIRQTREWLTRP
ncbi:hypothetical protein [Niabella hibiscisoli]|uniref:hypothetical protein n=1 Tax=Niabella hibiscisoli TaxID=1825928 RepID=UPI001F117291|nr:hypothetical protein [Niabella hibiscisoli]MCH5719192.1 hypothetical protein [Niabella hibiscisoli]